MNRLPKNVDDLDDLKKYWDKGYNYTIDYFMSDYSVKERTAITLLKDINYIGVSQKLSKNNEDIKREKYYKASDVLIKLVLMGEVIFKFNHFEVKTNINVKNEVVYYYTNDKNKKTVRSLEIPPKVVISPIIDDFYKILKESSSLREMAELQGLEYTDTVKKNLIRKMKKAEAFRIDVGGVVKYYLIDLNTDFELVERIIGKLKEYKGFR